MGRRSRDFSSKGANRITKERKNDASLAPLENAGNGLHHRLFDANQCHRAAPISADGTAAAGDDYYATSGTLTFNAGQTSQTITVMVIGNPVPEANETFYVNLSNAVNAALAVSQGSGTIIY